MDYGCTITDLSVARALLCCCRPLLDEKRFRIMRLAYDKALLEVLEEQRRQRVEAAMRFMHDIAAKFVPGSFIGSVLGLQLGGGRE